MTLVQDVTPTIAAFGPVVFSTAVLLSAGRNVENTPGFAKSLIGIAIGLTVIALMLDVVLFAGVWCDSDKSNMAKKVTYILGILLNLGILVSCSTFLHVDKVEADALPALGKELRTTAGFGLGVGIVLLLGGVAYAYYNSKKGKSDKPAVEDEEAKSSKKSPEEKTITREEFDRIGKQYAKEQEEKRRAGMVAPNYNRVGFMGRGQPGNTV